MTDQPIKDFAAMRDGLRIERLEAEKIHHEFQSRYKTLLAEAKELNQRDAQIDITLTMIAETENYEALMAEGRRIAQEIDILETKALNSKGL